MKLVWPVLAVCLVQAASAQPPEVPAEVREMIADLAAEQGMTPFGDVFLSRLDDGDKTDVTVKVARDKLTYVTIAGDDNVLDIKVRATAGGKAFVPDMDYGSGLVVIHLPEGNGDRATVEVDMSCEFIDCGYFVQAFVR